MKEQPIEPTISTREAGQMLGLSPSSICRMWRQGYLEGYKYSPSLHSRLRIYVKSVRQLLKIRNESPS